MTVGELQDALSQLDPATDLLMAFGDAFAPVEGLIAVPGGTFAVLRGRGKPRPGARFSIQEDGTIGKLNALKASDAVTGAVLGRDAESVKRRRKSLGLS
ncbi:MAG: hypothetical protein WCL32_01365 [Planctomycetota bacterium]